MLLIVASLTFSLKSHKKYFALGLDASWTPSEEEGPLPLSEKQHQQLLLLDEHISSSSNPEETLRQIAASSNMPEVELQKLLERNRALADQMSSSLRRRRHPSSVVSQLLSSIFLFLFQFAKLYPKRFSLCIVTVVSIFYVAYSIPRNGMVLSKGALFPISHGFTTVWKPPRAYVTSILSSTLQKQQKLLLKKHQSKSLPSLLLSQQFCTDKMPCNQVTVEKKQNRQHSKNKQQLKYSVTARTSVPIPRDLILQLLLLQGDDTLGEEKDDSSMDNTVEQSEYRAEKEALKLTLQAARSIVALRRFTEYVDISSSSKSNNKGSMDISFQTTSVEEEEEEHGDDADDATTSSSKEEVAALIVKSMGDYRRFGIQPFRLSYYQDNDTPLNNVADEESAVVLGYSTLNGGHWDGELRIAIDTTSATNYSDKKKNIKDYPLNAAAVIVSVSIIIPKKGGRKLSSDKLSSKIVAALADSISHSIAVETQRIVAQNIHRKRFSKQTHTLATDKRKIRYENIKKLEEMEQDRRRRRHNPDSGRYRPTGPRLPQQTKFR